MSVPIKSKKRAEFAQFQTLSQSGVGDLSSRREISREESHAATQRLKVRNKRNRMRKAGVAWRNAEHQPARKGNAANKRARKRPRGKRGSRLLGNSRGARAAMTEFQLSE